MVASVLSPREPHRWPSPPGTYVAYWYIEAGIKEVVTDPSNGNPIYTRRGELC